MLGATCAGFYFYWALACRPRGLLEGEGDLLTSPLDALVCFELYGDCMGRLLDN